MKKQAKKIAENMVCRNRIMPGQEFRADVTDDGTNKISGHPAVFNRRADIGGWFEEVIMPGAFDGCDMTDVALFTNHNDRMIPLARSRRNNGNSTMQLNIDDTGLQMDATLDTENNAEARTLFSAISRGDLDGMSFCFRVSEEDWLNLDSNYPTRQIKKISKVHEVSAVNQPAYEDTDIYARDKTALDNARQAVDTARAKGLESSSKLEIYKLKNSILSKGE